MADKKLNVVVLGAGMAGLISARYLAESGHEVTVYEQTSEIGGTWVYSDTVSTDEYGIKTHSSMYEGLRTNLPKEIMGIGDFTMPNDFEQSYLPSNKVLNFLDAYANQFEVKKFIRFRHLVIRVRSVENAKWEVIVKDLPSDKVTTHFFDAVFVCNGHNTAPYIPNFAGMDKFKGVQEHSHYYRKPGNYKDKDVLVIGSGPSGIDIAYAVSKVANRLTFCYRKHNPNHTLPANVTFKNEIREITETGAIFKDGSEQTFTNIIYCTGYSYTFPFLSADTGIHVDDNYVQPLYRHCINIEHPTMYIIGIPALALAPTLRYSQIRFCMKFLNGEKQLPTKADMYHATESDVEERRNAGLPKRKYHLMDTRQRAYFEQLAAEGEFEKPPNVISKIFVDSHASRMARPGNYRNDTYKIVDDETFVKSTVTPAV